MSNPEENRTNWEYKIFKLGPSSANSAEEVLNKLGSEGWELISFQPNGDHAYSCEGTYILKRTKS
ncbi:MAG: DUF4177 domain-containing protein [Pyrinomonadaceae bacterium]|nr:DUF4177 domain-containing protein [Pyrinomonadaceae bacterium]